MCTGGTAVDGGTFDNGYRVPFATDARFVQLLTPPSAPALLQSACVCWESGLNGAAMNFQFVFYDTSGVSGQPGKLVGSVPSATSIAAPFTQQFTGADCTQLGLALSGPTYIGVQYDSSSNVDFFICADESASTPQATMYESANGGFSWTPVQEQQSAARALGLRAVFGAATGCIPGDSTLCLNGSRFKVTATFDAGNGNAGNAHVVSLTGDTGYLWFFSSANVEAVIKVLNGCGLNNHYWVFAGGLTDVNVVITVTDMQTKTVQTYTNPRKTKFLPIQDTSAFATCP